MTSTAQQTTTADELRHIISKATTNSADGSPTLYTVLRHVSASGMTRHIDVYAIVDGEPRYLTARVATVLGYRREPRNGYLIVRGTGMDMGFHVVHSLAQRLAGDGYAYTSRWL